MSGGELESWRAWLAEFERVHGRPLRVLHIGNIANNAYINAKIQRRYGIEADVSCHDYFHVMGCPEWEDAPFSGDVGDPFTPDWWAVDLHGFTRPRWFAQGRLVTCQSYLLAVRRGQRVRAALLWRKLRFELWLRCRDSVLADLVRKAICHARPTSPLAAARRARTATRARAARVLRAVLAGPGATARAESPSPQPAPKPAEAPAATPSGPAGARLPYRLARVVEAFARAFPHRPPLTGDDLGGWAPAIDGWAELLDHYDIVQGYASDPIVPLLAGKRAFTAYEHGTLRDLPFADDTLGKVISIGFRSAPVTFVTNLDVPPRARLLGIPDERIVCLPHAVDDAAIAPPPTPGSPPPRPPACGPVRLLAPARQDWVDGDPRSSKGNDVFLRGLAEAVERGVQVQATLVDWGRDTGASRALCTELGLDEHIEWVGLLDKLALRRRFLEVHCVVDQFALPAFGSVTFEALALGCRVLTRLDAEAAAAFFGEAPPLLRAATPGEVADALELLAGDLADESGRGAAAAAWFERHHSSERIVELQVDAYRRVLAETQAHVPVAPAAARAHLVCPACQTALDWDDEAGRCLGCGSTYPVLRGIPRFVAQPEHGGIAQTQTAFDFEHRLYERSAWTRFDESLIGLFLGESGLPRSFFPGKRTLDAGCGSGRWSWALAELGADVTGIDLTEGGIEAAHRELGARPNARFAQADLFALPFTPESFDLVVSWGVLHHTPSTKAAFDRLVPLVAPGGTLFVMVYEDMGDHVQKGTNILRWLMRRLPPQLRWRASRLLVLRSLALFRVLSPWLMVAYWNPVTSPADFDSYRFGIYDAYSPRYNFVHTGDEVAGWFREAGFIDVERVPASAGAVRMRGVRPGGT